MEEASAGYLNGRGWSFPGRVWSRAVTGRDDHAAVSKTGAVGGKGDAAEPARGNTDAARPDASELRDRIAATLTDLAVSVQGTADVAERIAERADEFGRSDLAESERMAAKRARKLARRARAVARPLRRHEQP
jgi:hypothetical protein